MKKLQAGIVACILLCALAVGFTGTTLAADNLEITCTATASGSVAITLNQSTYAFGSVALSGSAVTHVDYFNLTNTGTINCDVTIQHNDSSDWTASAYASIGVDAFAMNFTVDDGSTYTEIANTGTTLKSNLGIGGGNHQDFGLKLWMPSSSTVGTEQSWKVYVSAVAVS